LQNFIAKVAKRRKTRRLLRKGGQGGHFREKGGKRGAFTCQIAVKTTSLQISYFLTRSGPWSPVANKKGYILLSNQHVINRGSINLNSDT
jgi:hypothetical protein